MRSCDDLEKPPGGASARSLAGWFLAGFVLILAFQAVWVSGHGGDWTALVHTGARLSTRERIEEELGPVVCVDSLGHDGQLDYLIARDPLALRDTPDFLREHNPPYRYRRILYPLLAGGFGLFSPTQTLLGMILMVAVGGGLVLAASADLCRLWSLPGAAMAFVLLNPGLYLGAQVLTDDVLALGFGLTGIALWQRQSYRLSMLCLAAAVLTKEIYLLIVLCVAGVTFLRGERRRAVMIASAASLPFALWALWIAWKIPGTHGMNNFALPGAGVAESVPIWARFGPAELCQGAVGVLMVVAALWSVWHSRSSLLRLSCLSWAGLALVLSVDVWGLPGNLLRTMAPLWMFAAFGYWEWRASTATDQPALAVS
jgi:hypothetical protein